MKKKKIILTILIATIISFGSLAAFASEEKVGGYPYLKESGEIDLVGYFALDGATSQLKEESIDFVMEGEKATLTFNKALASDNFGMYFSGVEGNALQKVEIILTDAENPEESLMLTFASLNKTNSIVKLNHANRSYIINGSFDTEQNSEFYAHYDAEYRHFSDDLSCRIPVHETLEGAVFSGFTSHKVTMTIRLYGGQGSVFRLKEINRQRMGTLYTNDTESPVITVINPMKKATINSVITAPHAFATDVLAENAKVTMSVTGPDRKEIITNVVPDKDYQIEIEQYGTYIVSYQATDGTNTTPAYSYMIAVQDQKKPEITLKESIPTSTKVGDTLEFPELTLKDNVSESENIKSWITVKYPGGVIMDVKDSVELKDKGVYEITFSATDEAGNVGRLTVKTYAEEDNHEE